MPSASGITFIVVLIVAVVLVVRWRKNVTWTGEVVDKVITHSVDEDGEPTSACHLKIKHDDSGKVKDHSVSSQKYNEFNKGDKVVKAKGKMGFAKA